MTLHTDNYGHHYLTNCDSVSINFVHEKKKKKNSSFDFSLIKLENDKLIKLTTISVEITLKKVEYSFYECGIGIQILTKKLSRVGSFAKPNHHLFI